MEATLSRKKAINTRRNIAREKVLVDIPQSDRTFFELFAGKMGWVVNDKQSLWENYINTCPKDIPLTDEDTIEAVREIRYGNM